MFVFPDNSPGSGGLDGDRGFAAFPAERLGLSGLS
jgi:hypothetical protein